MIYFKVDENKVLHIYSVIMLRRSDKQPDRVEISPEQLSDASSKAEVGHSTVTTVTIDTVYKLFMTINWEYIWGKYSNCHNLRISFDNHAKKSFYNVFKYTYWSYLQCIKVVCQVKIQNICTLILDLDIFLVYGHGVGTLRI